MKGLLSVLVGLISLTVSTYGFTLVNTFSPNRGQLNAIGFNPADGLVHIHPSFDAQIYAYQPDGTFVSSITHPGTSTNDSDLNFVAGFTTILDTLVPPGTMLVVNGESDPQTLFAVDPADGNVLLTLALAEPIGQLTGGGFDPLSGELVTIDWQNDVIITFDTANGQQIRTFGFGAGWDAFFSDVEVGPNGNLYLVSDAQNVIRVLDPEGSSFQDFDVGPLGISGMSGIAIDPINNDAYISSTNGSVYHIEGLEVVPEPRTWALIIIGITMIGLTFRRRIFKRVH
ncbi:MAG: PEP-CTERM sorting domain-containing protein [Verrucomicrobiota bacterium]